jgi:RNA polymerase sigma-70 factor (ECF subfamily)
MTARIFVGVSVAEPAASTLETAAAARLYERHSSRVFGYCLGMLRSREDAEDAAQTTFMQAFRALQRGVVPTFETAWLLTIAKNVCLARHRAGSRRKAVEFARDPHDLAEIAAGAEAPNGVLMGLQDALARLPEMQRRAFLLREWQGRTYVEIAAELGVTVSAVEALIFRARRALARDLDGDAKRRGHAFDLASLAGALKSFLGGGAAVKVAVGAAAVVSAGAVVGGTLQRSEAPAPARERQSPLATAEASGAGSSRPSPSVRSDRAAGAQVASKSSRKSAPSPAATPGPVTPSAPAGSSPQPGPGPGQPAAEAQTQSPVPVAPAVPGVPDPPAVSPPPVELPQLPIDQLPVEVPQVPELPGVPDVVPELPAVPDVPDLHGVPELPKLP